MPDSDFTRASRAVWEAMASGWEERRREFEDAARPVAERMIEALGPRPGQSVLDLATGTGIVGLMCAPALGPEGRMILGDFAESMVRAAERRARELGLANVECRVLDAEQLDMDDDSVDGVLCRWGYMLMGDPAAALAETRRVLRPGGRLSLAVFAGPAANPWAAIPGAVMVEQGHMAPPEPGAPGILAMGDPDRVRTLLTDAGFGEPRVDEVAFTFWFADAEAYWRFLTEAAGAIAAVIERLDPEQRARAREGIERAIEPLRDGDGLRMPAVSLVASAG